MVVFKFKLSAKNIFCPSSGRVLTALNYDYSAPVFWQICYEANVFIIATQSLRQDNPPRPPFFVKRSTG